MARRTLYLLQCILVVALAGCRPYESQTLDMGERGIQPVLSREETSDDREHEARRAALEQSIRETQRLLKHPLVDDRHWPEASSSVSPPPWPGEADSDRQRALPPRSVGADSPEFEACAQRYDQSKRELDRYRKTAPAFVMVQVTVDKPPERVSCSQIKFYSRMDGEQALVYSKYLNDCQPFRATGSVYEAAKAKADKTQQECFGIARRTGVSQGEARSRLR